MLVARNKSHSTTTRNFSDLMFPSRRGKPGTSGRISLFEVLTGLLEILLVRVEWAQLSELN